MTDLEGAQSISSVLSAPVRVGILRVPDDEQWPQCDHHVGDRHRPGVPRLHVCAPTGGHGGDVSDPDALFRSVAGLSSHLNPGGSLAPIIALRLLETYKSAVPIAWYLAATAAVTAVAVLAARKTKGVDLVAIDLADAQSLAARQGPAQSASRPDGPEPIEVAEGAV